MKTVVLIPLYRNYLLDYEAISIRQNTRILKDFHIYFISPLKLKNNTKFEELVKKYKTPVHYFDDKFFKNINGYNKLMLNLEFYKFYIRYDFMLICQLDALVLFDRLDYWVKQNYDYIGAPWLVKSDNPYFDSMGNGGFSLRKIQSFILVLTSSDFFYSSDKYICLPVRLGLKNLFLLRAINKLNKACHKINYLRFFLMIYNTNEDYFWAFLAKFFINDFILPSPKTALRFSFEVEPKQCYKLNNNKLPFGCHAFQKYDIDFWTQNIPEIKNIK